MLLAKQWKLFTDYRTVLGVVSVCEIQETCCF